MFSSTEYVSAAIAAKQVPILKIFTQNYCCNFVYILLLLVTDDVLCENIRRATDESDVVGDSCRRITTGFLNTEFV